MTENDADLLRDEVTFTAALCAEGMSLPADAVDASTLASAAHLAGTADRALHLLVSRSRSAGRSWAEIGEALGITRQAAQRRFSAAPPRRVTRERPEPDPRLVELGRGILEELAAGRPELLEEHLGARSRAALGGSGAPGVVQGVQETFGAFRSRESFTARAVGQVVVIRSRENREIRPADAGVSLAADGTVIGLHYLLAPEDAPRD